MAGPGPLGEAVQGCRQEYGSARGCTGVSLCNPGLPSGGLVELQSVVVITRAPITACIRMQGVRTSEQLCLEPGGYVADHVCGIVEGTEDRTLG